MKLFSKLLSTTLLLLTASFAMAGGWDADKGADKTQIQGELVCLGCSLKKGSGANAQCSLFTQHDMGVKLADGTLWSIVNNAKGHDIIRAHGLVSHKNAQITGWLYPTANHIEIDSINVDGVSAQAIAQAAWEEDQKVAKALLNRKVGEAPTLEAHGHSH
jgi:hypothetical protein